MDKIVFLTRRIKSDLVECRISWKVALLFIPVAFFTYLFHEFGHWVVGEVLGNDMVLSLNIATARNGHYVDKSHGLFISIGGPAFTILQAIVFLVVIERTKTIYAYPFVFFAAFIRFFSIVFGGLSQQDEARISSMLGLGKYPVAILVLLMLVLIAWRSSHSFGFNLKAIGYYFSLSTLSILLVLGVNGLSV